jgi:gliding motility-associated-like protein
MCLLLRFKFVWLLVVLLAAVSLSTETSAQGCQGADTSGIFTGSIANRDNGTICANNPVQPGLMEIDIGNIDELSGGTVEFEINWDDGSAPERVNGVRIGPNRYFAAVSHLFPPNGAQVKCEYRPDVRLVYNGAVCAANLGTPPRFVRWNTDDQQTGDLSLLESITNVNEYLVCAGIETNVTFTDRSDLNCVPPDLILGPNDKRRWRQFVYGTNNTITGTVRIGGFPTAFPSNGSVSISTEPITNSGFPTATTEIITVPASALVGEVFEITMNYWNTCNSFPARPPVTERARIRVVAQPLAPAGTDQTVCRGTTPSDFTITGVPPNNIVNWYRNVPGSPDAPGTLITSGTSTTLNFTPANVPGYVNNTTAGIYSVWASYTPNVANALNCESPRIQMTRTIRNVLTISNPTTAPPAEICNNNSFTIVLPNPATEPFGGATQYNYNGATGVTVGSSTANSVTYDAAVTFLPGELFVDRTVSVQRRYTTNPNCTSTRNFTVRIYDETVGGTPSNFPNVCEGTSVGPITLSGHVGTIIGWEVEVNGGGFNPYAGPASGNAITPGVLSDGTYRFRAVVDNGPCNTVRSAIETVVITDNPTPPTAGTDQAFCGSLVSAAQDATLPLGTGTWSYLGSVPTGRPMPTFTANNPTTTFSITNATLAGAYTMRWSVVIGSCTFEDDVVIDFGSNPDPVPVMTVNQCGETATLTAPVPSIGTGEWTIISGPGGCVTGTCPQITIADVNSPISTVSLNGALTYGSYILEWRVTSGICAPAFNNATVTFNRVATATASDINGICLASTGTAIPLTGTFGGGATSGTWVNVDGLGSIGSITVAGNTVNAVYNATAADYAAGTPIRVKLQAMPPGVSNCPIVEQEITINVDRTPVADAGPASVSVCDNFYQLNAQSPIPFGATGAWTGPGTVTFDDPSDPLTTVRNLPAPGNSVTLRWTLTSAGGNLCTHFDQIIVNRIVAPNATDLNPVLCEVAPAGGPLTTQVLLTDYEASVTSLPIASRTITWYEDGAPPLGSPIASPGTTLSNVPDGKVYVARIFESGTGCTSDAVVSINVRALPTAQNATVALCEDSPGTNTAINTDLLGSTRFRDAVTTPGNIVSWHNSVADAQANVSPIVAAIPTITGFMDVFARITYGTAPACPTVVRLRLQVNQLPDNVPINGDPTVCMGASGQPIATLPVQTYQVASVPGAKYYWNIPTGPGQFVVFAGGGDDDFYVLLQFPFNATLPAPPIENLTVRIELNGCSSSTLQLPIARSRQPVAPVILGDAFVCENEDAVHYFISTPSPSSDYNWEIRRQSDNSIGGAFVTSGQTLPDVFVEFSDEDVIITVTEVNSVCSSPDTPFPVTVNLLPVMLDDDRQICSDLPTNIVFAAAPSSPVTIDKFTMSNAIYTPGLVIKNATAGPFPLNNLPADFIEDHVFENLTATPLAVNYTVTPISVGAGALECRGTTQIITVNVKPEPQLSPSLNRGICSGVETGITLISANNTFPSDRFIINSITVPPGVIALSPIPTADGVTLYLDDVIRDNVWENRTGVNQVVRYEILPYSTLLGCAGNPATTVDVTIYPLTDVVVSDQVLCNGDLLNVTFTSILNPGPTPGTPGANFLWRITGYDADIVLGSPAAGMNDITGMIITNTSLTDDRYVYFEVRGKNFPAEEGLDECANPIETFSVLIRKSPIAVPRDFTECSDVAGGNTFTADLESKESSVTPNAGDPDYRIIWYENRAPDGTLSSVIPDDGTLNAYVMTNGVAVYMEIEYLLTACKKVVPVKYIVHPQISILDPDLTAKNLKCNNDATGEIQLDVVPVPAYFGGYFYSLDGGPSVSTTAGTYTFKSLGAGAHVIRVEDINGCFVTDNVTLTEPAPLSATLAIANPISCFLGTDGSIQATAVGGTQPIVSYLLLQTNTIDPNNDGLFANLRAGSYSVRVQDTNGCKTEAILVPDLLEPAQVQASATVVTDANGYALTCKDAQDGQINVTAAGGISGTTYTYTLVRSGDPTNPFREIAGAGPSTSFQNLPFGSYTLTVRDVNSCPSQPVSVIIVNPPPFIAGLIGINQSVCDGEDPLEIEELVPPFGGVGEYKFKWYQSFTGSNIESDWVEIMGATASTFDPPARSQTTYYRRLVFSGTPPAGPALPGDCGWKGFDNKIEVTVNPLPLANFEPPSSGCQGDDVIFTLTLTRGESPFTYDYTNGSTIFSNETGFVGVNGAGTPIVVSNLQAPTTLTILKITDLNGCVAAVLPDPASVQLTKINPDFEILAPSAQCAGGKFTFQWMIEPGVKYTWTWADGKVTTINNPQQPGPNDRAVGLDTITHVFASGSTESPTIYPVTLKAENPVCQPKSSTKEVTVYPSIFLNILPGDLILCSGETTRFRDQSAGVDIGTWFYREKGTTDRLDVRTGPFTTIDYTFTNNTAANPLIYEVVYEAANDEGCTAQYMEEVKVYRGITAIASNTPPTPFAGGVSTVVFTNNSTPLDGSAFEYTWDFDDIKAIPATGTGTANYTVDYFSAGTKNVRLTAVNIAARDIDGKICKSVDTPSILIIMPIFGADFKATPLAACFPVDITVQNLSPGADTFLWELYNQNGLVTTSNLKNPVFRILDPGVYDIRLTATILATGQTAWAEQKGIEVFDVPSALFELRPNPLYVPDTELQTFNKSVRATSYEWIFDDGTTSSEFEPRHLYTIEGKYNVKLIAGFDNGNKDVDGDGILDGNLVCYDTTTQELVALDGGYIKLPNAFTPTQSGSSGGVAGSGTFNDVFLPIMRGVEEFQMMIFDRWGNLLFESKDKDVGWDGYDKNGKPLPAGVYVYKLVLRLSDGQRTTKIGDVTLIK